MKRYLSSYTLSTNNSDLVNDYIIEIASTIMVGEFDDYMEHTSHDSARDGLIDFVWNYLYEKEIYTRELWNLIENYFSPHELCENADIRAIELLTNDIISALEISEEDDEEGGEE